MDIHRPERTERGRERTRKQRKEKGSSGGCGGRGPWCQGLGSSATRNGCGTLGGLLKFPVAPFPLLYQYFPPQSCRTMLRGYTSLHLLCSVAVFISLDKSWAAAGQGSN